MRAPDWTRDPVGWIEWFAGLGTACLKDAGRFDECTLFWGIVGAAVGIVCALGLLIFMLHFLRERRKFRQAWARQAAESEVAPPEVMSQHQWAGNDLVDPSVSVQEIARRIEEARVRKRLQNDTSAATDKGDKALGIDILHR